MIGRVYSAGCYSVGCIHGDRVGRLWDRRRDGLEEGLTAAARTGGLYPAVVGYIELYSCISSYIVVYRVISLYIELHSRLYLIDW